MTSDTFIVPPDFRRVYGKGAVMMADGSFARPVMAATSWEIIRKSSSSLWYFLDGKTLRLSSFSSPVTFFYISYHWILGSDGKNKAMISLDDDVPVFPEHLLVKNVLWRWRRSQGLVFQDELQEFEGSLALETSLFEDS
ncbi:hypothetical protein [Liberibacter crescens]|uniref:hypothetical protein n=1 Tax=Liberibacter crescens TaxID=1273132 RepID=UPI001181ACE8|nr:hypothetical protein [Liberibacter crescens]